jgi:hypothetical protein
MAMGWACELLAKRYDSKKSAPTTFLYNVLDNWFRGYLTALGCQKRTAEEDSLDDVAYQLADKVSPERISHALNNVATLYYFASPRLQFFLDTFVFNPATFPAPKPLANEITPEFRQLARLTGASFQDFRTALNIAPGALRLRVRSH